jgi:hypothetical protein
VSGRKSEHRRRRLWDEDTQRKRRRRSCGKNQDERRRASGRATRKTETLAHGVNRPRRRTAGELNQERRRISEKNASRERKTEKWRRTIRDQATLAHTSWKANTGRAEQTEGGKNKTRGWILRRREEKIPHRLESTPKITPKMKISDPK